MTFRFIDAHRDTWPVRVLCEALEVSPSGFYSWLKRRGLPAPLALLIMVVALSILFAALFGFLSVSIGKFTGPIAFYTTQLDIRTD